MIKTNLTDLTSRRDRYKRDITLISGGYYAPKAFPGGVVTVYPWDSATDAWFANRSRQPRREYALWESVAQVANLNGCPVNGLLMGDAMTIIMVSRSIRTKSVVSYIAECPKCSKRHDEKITIPDELAKLAVKPHDFSGQETMILPECKDEVVFRFLTIGEAMSIEERSDEDRQKMSDHLANILKPILTVGGGTPDGVEEIVKWYSALSPADSDYLEKEQDRRYPKLDTSLQHVCEGCRSKFTHDLDLNRDFFRAGER